MSSQAHSFLMVTFLELRFLSFGDHPHHRIKKEGSYPKITTFSLIEILN